MIEINKTVKEYQIKDEYTGKLLGVFYKEGQAYNRLETLKRNEPDLKLEIVKILYS